MPEDDEKGTDEEQQDAPPEPQKDGTEPEKSAGPVETTDSGDIQSKSNRKKSKENAE